MTADADRLKLRAPAVLLALSAPVLAASLFLPWAKPALGAPAATGWQRLAWADVAFAGLAAALLALAVLAARPAAPGPGPVRGRAVGLAGAVVLAVLVAVSAALLLTVKVVSRVPGP